MCGQQGQISIRSLMRLEALAKGRQLRLVAQQALRASRRLSTSRPASQRPRKQTRVVAQARQSAALRELEQQQEERAALAQESQIPVGEAELSLMPCIGHRCKAGHTTQD